MKPILFNYGTLKYFSVRSTGMVQGKEDCLNIVWSQWTQETFPKTATGIAAMMCNYELNHLTLGSLFCR